MSLHSLANHLQSAGRGEDKVLVHMTPGEVKGLQSLAMAHGGSLTINPETGLPEAGILKSLLPMIAGFALGPAGLGMTAMQAGLTTAAVGAAATGSLTKGLMAGLGAYSGAGLGAGLQSMATPAAAPAVPGLSPTVAANASTLGGTAPLSNVGAENLLTSTDDLLMQGAKNVPIGGYDPSMSSVFVKNAPVPTVAPADASKLLGTDATNQAVLGKLGYTGPGSLPVAGAKPVPFSESFPTGNSVVPLEPQAVPVRSTGSYYDSTFKEMTPVERSGFGIRGGAAQAGKPITTISDTGGAYSGSYTGVGDNVLLRSNQPVLDVAQTSPYPLDDALVDPNVASYDKSIMSRGPFRADYPTITASKDLVSTSPIDAGSQYFADINSKIRTSPAVSELARSGRTEIIVDPTMTEPASITQYTRPFTDRMAELGRGAKASFSSLEGLKGLHAATEAAAPYGTYAGLGSTAYSMYEEKRQQMEDEARARAEASRGLIRPYTFDYGVGGGNVSAQPYYGSAERTYFRPSYTELPSYKAPGPEYAAKGGLMSLAVGGPVEEMAAMNSVGANTGYPMAALQTPVYSNPAMQRPEALNVIAPSADAGVGSYSGELRFAAGGGISHLGDYSDGGRLLKGPGDGVSDSIPASIGNRQPARLADGEFVVPARIVSEIGNGSTEAGARKLYAMMDRVQKARRKTTGKNQVARNTKAERLLPA